MVVPAPATVAASATSPSGPAMELVGIMWIEIKWVVVLDLGIREVARVV
jgi:hypothetical protein